MNKLYLLVGMAALLLVGCSDNGSDAGRQFYDRTQSVSVSGVLERGFFLKPDSTVIQIGERTPPDYWIESWSDFVLADSADGSFTVTSDGFLGSYAELYSPQPTSFYDERDSQMVYLPKLLAAIDLSDSGKANVNYLTSMIAQGVWSKMESGMSYKDAWSKSAKALLKCLHMPEDLTDFTHYSLYGKTEGDAMLAAVSILVEKSGMFGGYSNSFDKDELCNSEVFEGLANMTVGYVYNGTLDSLRREIESRSPKGKVANYEKYLSIFFADLEGYDRCTPDIQGKLIGHQDYYYEWIVCKDSVWQKAEYSDFDTTKIFNSSVEYGTLVDPRDGRVYKTVDMGTYTLMAENLRYADSASTENLKGQTWCYDNKESNCESFGRLYSWTAAMDIPKMYLDSSYSEDSLHRGICPEGWHVATDKELSTVDYRGSALSAFMTEADNKSGFSVVPGGMACALYEYGEGGAEVYTGEIEFRGLGEYTYVWTSDIPYMAGSAGAWYYAYSTDDSRSQAHQQYDNRHYGFYVRCAQDPEE